MEKAIFLDRDGIINKDYEYVYKIEKFEIIKGVFESLIELQKNNYLLFIVTNQSGIGRGFYSEKDFEKLNKYMIELFEKKGIKINSVEYCPHYIDSKNEKYKLDCNCRKPNIGMFKKISKKYKIDIQNSYMIGDKKSDIEFGNKSKLKTILISSKNNLNYGQKNICNNLYDATFNVILKK